MTPDQAKKLLRGVVENTLSPGPVPHPRRVELTTIVGSASDVGFALQLLTQEGLAGDELKFWDQAFLDVHRNVLATRAGDPKFILNLALDITDEAVLARRERLTKGIPSP